MGLLLGVQFFSVLNDNLLKQVVLLMLATASFSGARVDLQAMGLLAFALPILVASPLAGVVTDRYPRTRVVVWTKFAEVVPMLLAVAGLAVPGAWSAPLTVAALVLMATQTAFLTPAKYGTLTEIVGQEGVVRANWLMQTVSYLTTVLGVALAGVLLTAAGDRRWVVGVVCLGLAVLGWAIALALPRTPPPANRPAWPRGLALLVPHGIKRTLAEDPMLRDAMLVYMSFWLAAGLMHPTANAMGLNQLGFDAGQTSLLPAAAAMGVVAGCLAAAALSRGVLQMSHVRAGGWCMAALQATITAPGVGAVHWGSFGGLLACFFLLGAASGFFVVPLHTLIQVRPPDGEKGRLLAAMNQINWAALVASAGLYQILSWFAASRGWPPSSVLLMTSAASAVGLLWLRPNDDRLIRPPWTRG